MEGDKVSIVIERDEAGWPVVDKSIGMYDYIPETFQEDIFRVLTPQQVRVFQLMIEESGIMLLRQSPRRFYRRVLVPETQDAEYEVMYALYNLFGHSRNQFLKFYNEGGEFGYQFYRNEQNVSALRRVMSISETQLAQHETELAAAEQRNVVLVEQAEFVQGPRIGVGELFSHVMDRLRNSLQTIAGRVSAKLFPEHEIGKAETASEVREWAAMIFEEYNREIPQELLPEARRIIIGELLGMVVKVIEDSQYLENWPQSPFLDISGPSWSSAFKERVKAQRQSVAMYYPIEERFLRYPGETLCQVLSIDEFWHAGIVYRGEGENLDINNMFLLARALSLYEGINWDILWEEVRMIFISKTRDFSETGGTIQLDLSDFVLELWQLFNDWGYGHESRIMFTSILIVFVELAIDIGRYSLAIREGEQAVGESRTRYFITVENFDTEHRIIERKMLKELLS